MNTNVRNTHDFSILVVPDTHCTEKEALERIANRIVSVAKEWNAKLSESG